MSLALINSNSISSVTSPAEPPAKMDQKKGDEQFFEAEKKLVCQVYDIQGFRGLEAMMKRMKCEMKHCKSILAGQEGRLEYLNLDDVLEKQHTSQHKKNMKPVLVELRKLLAEKRKDLNSAAARAVLDAKKKAKEDKKLLAKEQKEKKQKNILFKRLMVELRKATKNVREQEKKREKELADAVKEMKRNAREQKKAEAAEKRAQREAEKEAKEAEKKAKAAKKNAEKQAKEAEKKAKAAKKNAEKQAKGAKKKAKKDKSLVPGVGADVIAALIAQANDSGVELKPIEQPIAQEIAVEEIAAEEIAKQEILAEEIQDMSSAEDSDQEAVEVVKFTYNGKVYLRDDDNVLYDIENQDYVGDVKEDGTVVLV